MMAKRKHKPSQIRGELSTLTVTYEALLEKKERINGELSKLDRRIRYWRAQRRAQRERAARTYSYW